MLPRAQAARTDLNGLGHALNHDADLLQVRQPATAGMAVRVTNRVATGRTLTAIIANSGHYYVPPVMSVLYCARFRWSRTNESAPEGLTVIESNNSGSILAQGFFLV